MEKAVQIQASAYLTFVQMVIAVKIHVLQYANHAISQANWEHVTMTLQEQAAQLESVMEMGIA
jgi:hypothetical protein